MKLIVPILINCLLVLLVYFADKHTPLKKLPYAAKQIIIGLMFGALSAFASDFGVEMLGTTVNVRDSAPLSAGLIFGAPAGIIAGFIGGLYRWFSVAWGAGTYTRLACTLATILAGLMAAALRKFMFDDKKPTWGYSIAITVVCEVIHMLLILITNMTDSNYAFEFVKGATVPVIIGNSVAVGVSVVLVSLLSRERLFHKKGSEHIAETFQRWLLICIVVAYLATSVFTFFLQNGMASRELGEIFKSAISDVKQDVSEKSDEYMAALVDKVAADYAQNPDCDLVELAKRHAVIEINIIKSNGIIDSSTDEAHENSFDMYSTDQSREFFTELVKNGTYVQDYGPIGLDGKTMRKYAGTAVGDDEYLQIGYGADQFHEMLDGFVIDVTKNRHVGSNGFVAVCNEQLMLVTEDVYNGKHISNIGIDPVELMLERRSATELLKANVRSANSADGQSEGEEYLYAFTFAEGYCIIAAMPSADAMAMRDASIYNTVFMQVIVFGTLFVFIYILVKRVIINNLRKINSSLAEITDGNLDVTVDVRSNTEFASLSDDINTTVTTLKRYIAEAAARIDRELEYAKQIQLSVLPTKFPEDEDYGIYAQMIAAKEVGGDFYDFYRIDKKNVAFLVADVSGKGIPAAMFMMTAKTIIKDLAERGLEVNEIFTLANEKLCENNESGMFVTAWMGILNLESGKLSYANAGHNPPLLRRADGEFEYLRSRAGFVLAGLEGVRYRANEIEFGKGDRIFLYTDGVTEATDTENQLYGENRLVGFMNLHADMAADKLLPALKENIDGFVGEAPQFDDMTMLMFDYRPGKEKTAMDMEKRIFPASTDALGEVIGFVEESLERYEASMKVTMAVSIAIEEVFVNVAHYAYGDGEGEVDLSIGFDGESRELSFIMEDSGVQFDPLSKPDPDVTLSADEREIGGLGIFITKKTMDSVTYSYENGKNILRMVKKI